MTDAAATRKLRGKTTVFHRLPREIELDAIPANSVQSSGINYTLLHGIGLHLRPDTVKSLACTSYMRYHVVRCPVDAIAVVVADRSRKACTGVVAHPFRQARLISVGLCEAGFELVPAFPVFCFAQVQPHMEATRQTGEASVQG